MTKLTVFRSSSVNKLDEEIDEWQGVMASRRDKTFDIVNAKLSMNNYGEICVLIMYDERERVNPTNS